MHCLRIESAISCYKQLHLTSDINYLTKNKNIFTSLETGVALQKKKNLFMSFQTESCLTFGKKKKKKKTLIRSHDYAFTSLMNIFLWVIPSLDSLRNLDNLGPTSHKNLDLEICIFHFTNLHFTYKYNKKKEKTTACLRLAIAYLIPVDRTFHSVLTCFVLVMLSLDSRNLDILSSNSYRNQELR